MAFQLLAGADQDQAEAQARTGQASGRLEQQTLALGRGHAAGAGDDRFGRVRVGDRRVDVGIDTAVDDGDFGQGLDAGDAQDLAAGEVADGDDGAGVADFGGELTELEVVEAVGAVEGEAVGHAEGAVGVEGDGGLGIGEVHVYVGQAQLAHAPDEQAGLDEVEQRPQALARATLVQGQGEEQAAGKAQRLARGHGNRRRQHPPDRLLVDDPGVAQLAALEVRCALEHLAWPHGERRNLQALGLELFDLAVDEGVRDGRVLAAEVGEARDHERFQLG